MRQRMQQKCFLEKMFGGHCSRNRDHSVSFILQCVLVGFHDHHHGAFLSDHQSEQQSADTSNQPVRRRDDNMRATQRSVYCTEEIWGCWFEFQHPRTQWKGTSTLQVPWSKALKHLNSSWQQQTAAPCVYYSVHTRQTTATIKTQTPTNIWLLLSARTETICIQYQD